MNIALNSEATADKSRETYRKTYDQFEVVTLAAFPQAARELAETSVAQTHEAYERSKLMALSGHFTCTDECPLLGAKQTSLIRSPMSGNDPKRTF